MRSPSCNGARPAQHVREEDLLYTTVAYLEIAGMECVRCEQLIREALLQHVGVALVGLSLADKIACVAYYPALLRPSQLLDIVEQAGCNNPYRYEVTLLRTMAPETAPPHGRTDVLSS